MSRRKREESWDAGDPQDENEEEMEDGGRWGSGNEAAEPAARPHPVLHPAIVVETPARKPSIVVEIPASTKRQRRSGRLRVVGEAVEEADTR